MSDLLFFLEKVRLFTTLRRSDLKYLATGIRSQRYALGEYLFHPRDEAKNLYIVKSGEIEIVKKIGDITLQFTRLGSGDFSGESIILGKNTHTMACRAIIDSEVLLLSQNTIHELLRKEPLFASKLAMQLTHIIKERYSSNLEDSRTRTEKDLLGTRQVPYTAYYGIQTLRATELYNITGIPISHFPTFVKALAMVKLAAAQTNLKLEDLNPEIGKAASQACKEIIDGNLHEQFIVDMLQGGAGTSTNMNANEVIANRALEILGHHRGDYSIIHPNKEINKSQSTNDVYPTAIRLGILLNYKKLRKAMAQLAQEFGKKSKEFANVVKMGRTQLQDAVPMTLGQEFEGYRVTVKEDMQQIDKMVRLFREINLGATAIGTGITARARYTSLVVEELSQIAGMKLICAENLIEATSDVGAFVSFSAILKRISIKISKICNDLRLLSSGPRTGLNEINLPPLLPGSSIMPGKVNPVIPEMFTQVAYQIIGNDLTITMAAEAGQLQLNVMEPVIAFNIFQSINALTRAITTLSKHCIKNISANVERCFELVENSIGIVTALVPHIGYEAATQIAKKALETNRNIMELVKELHILPETKLEEILSPRNMLQPYT